ncbi:DUF1772-domain-containing protein [Tothia fuscella]|uniref:DUF1772-domain-containing protein n=1 Tax=Tothia fuscella TaxID=1048955 RepID=A0A9P4NQ64_9PEZI|nr:DUF1772-domain-containing protein [Tothia fuscella]
MASRLASEAPKVGIQATALVAASFLSGAMMSLSAIAIPVFLDTNTETAHLLRQWARLYHYGHIYMPTLAVGTTGLYAYVGLRKRAANDKKWIRYVVAGAVTISIVPFTWLMMAPTNDTLFELEKLALANGTASVSVLEASIVQEQVVKWAWLHVVRAVFPLVGAILGLVSVLQEFGV